MSVSYWKLKKKNNQVFVNILMQFVGAMYVFPETPLLPECERNSFAV